MKNITLKITGLFVAVFAVAQLGAVDKAGAAGFDNGVQKKILGTDSHGCGCGCGTCTPPVETSI